MGALTQIYLGLLFSVAPVGVLIGLFCMARAYTIYRMLGDQIGKLSFYWFYFQYLSPNLAKQLPAYIEYVASLPDDQKARAIAVRRQIRFGLVALVFWVIFVFLFGALTAYLGRPAL